MPGQDSIDEVEEAPNSLLDGIVPIYRLEMTPKHVMRLENESTGLVKVYLRTGNVEVGEFYTTDLSPGKTHLVGGSGTLFAALCGLPDCESISLTSQSGKTACKVCKKKYDEYLRTLEIATA